VLRREDGQPCKIAARMGEAGDESDLYGIGQGHEHDRHSGGRMHRSQGLGRPRRQDDIHVEPDQLGGEGVKLIALGRMAMLKPLAAASCFSLDTRHRLEY
jgi:hypothetical protein